MTTDTNTTTTTTNGKATRQLTAVEAISKVAKILDTLSEADRKRVMAFLNADTE